MSLPSAKKLMLTGGGRGIDRLFATTVYTDDAVKKLLPLGFAPELMWTKIRNPGSETDHWLYDSLRGQSALRSNNSGQAFGSTNSALAPDGVTRGIRVGDASFRTAVAWSFRRAARFFDIVTFTGNGQPSRKIPHRLGISPGMAIVKRLDNAGSWSVLHRSLPVGSNYLDLASSAAAGYNGGNGLEAMDATSFTVANNALNVSGATYVAYLFAHDPSSQGVIQCGRYLGNGLSPGPAIDLGWQPQFLMIKALGMSGSMGNWRIIDDKRDQASLLTRSALFPNTAGSELSEVAAAFTATGFQVGDGNHDWNREPSFTNPGGYAYLAIRKGKA